MKNRWASQFLQCPVRSLPCEHVLVEFLIRFPKAECIMAGLLFVRWIDNKALGPWMLGGQRALTGMW